MTPRMTATTVFMLAMTTFLLIAVAATPIAAFAFLPSCYICDTVAEGCGEHCPDEVTSSDAIIDASSRLSDTVTDVAELLDAQTQGIDVPEEGESDTLGAISTSTNTIIATIPVG